MPLAVMLASLSANLPASAAVRVHILQRQLSATLRQMVEQSVDVGVVNIAWVDVGPDKLTSLSATLRSFDTVSLESYYRLLLPSVLPGDVDKVLYLDSDLVVVRDVTPLWDLDVSSTSLIAVPELAPAARLVSSPDGIALYRELGLPPDLKFFNSGVMLINLRKWREEHVALRAYIYLEAAADYLRWHDQEALNAVLAGDWRELDPCWNVTMHLFRRGADTAQRRDLLREACIVHYNSAIKPWQRDFSLGFRDLFFHYLDKTAWSSWRPDQRSPLVLRLTNQLRRAAQKRFHIGCSRFRRLGAMVASSRVLRGRVRRIDANPVPSGPRHELRAFIDVVGPGPALGELLNHYDEIALDRIFLLVGRDRVAEARSLAGRVDLHVVMKETEIGHSVHLILRSLLNRFAVNHWCLLLNSNEFLCYPDAERVSLRDFCQQLDVNKFEAVAGQIIDTRLADAASQHQTLPAVQSLHSNESRQRQSFQRDSFSIAAVARDPVTRRVFPTRLLMDAGSSDGELAYRSKVALLKYASGMRIAEEFRAVHGVRMANVEAAVLRVAGGIPDVQPWAACQGIAELLKAGMTLPGPR